jgi:trimeric autotransporter adhesin
MSPPQDNSLLGIGSFMTADAVRTVTLSNDRHHLAIGAHSRSVSVRDRTIPKSRTIFGLLLPFVLLASQAMAATYTVTNLNNSGAGSLRQAILAANAKKGSTIAFETSGTINLSSPLPDISAQVTIDGTTAPGFTGTPVICINFNFTPGLTFAAGADSSTLKSLSLVNAGSAAVTLLASRVTVQGNYIGLLTNGAAAGNLGDGVRILEPSAGNLIGNSNPVASIAYMDTSDFDFQPVSAWQGIRNYAEKEGQYLICGTSNQVGLLYLGPIFGGGETYTVQYPGADTIATSVYGPDNLQNGGLRLVGSYRKTGASSIYNYGFVWEGKTNQLPSGGVFRTIAYPGATIQFTHSTMGNLAVGNAAGPAQVGIAYIYDLSNNTFVANLLFPGSKTTTAYGIWQNGRTKYTICGGYSPLATQNLTNQKLPLAKGKGYLVDYDSAKNEFSNWTSFEYPNGPVGVNFVTHFEGISSTEPGTYSLNADSVQVRSNNVAQGSWVSVRRNSDGTFDKGTWVDLNYPDSPGSITSSNSVYGYQVVGLVVGATVLPFEATVDVGFQLSNVISGNRGNGIKISGSKGNVIAMNYIGTDSAGSATPNFGNRVNGILITGASSGNLIGGQAAGINNPTGSKNPANAVFQRPPQGNLISGNLGNGVLINGASTDNLLCGNFIGTDATGSTALGNGQDGVAIDNANNNSLIGCTLYQNPFVFYNVIAGNQGNGLSITNADNVTVQANFLGIGADNMTMIPNRGNGLVVAGNSENTQVGGVIPLGNVISGNLLNGILVRDTVSNFISFNTFGGIAAFQTFASPNGLDGILITSTGANNTVRTCIISGNNANGIEIGGNASGVQITETSVGTTTTISAAIPNQENGILISGEAHDNAIGGFQPSVEPNVFVSGNKKYGIAVMDRAYNNRIFHSTIGVGAGAAGAIPNAQGGILLDIGSSGTIVGGKATPLHNVIQSNTEAGLSIYSSKQNTVLNNSIEENSVVGVYASGVCNGTLIGSNAILNNGTNGSNNVDIANATGITFKP